MLDLINQYVFMCACILYIYIYVFMCLCVHVRIPVPTFCRAEGPAGWPKVCRTGQAPNGNVYMYSCIYIYIYICICIHIYIYIGQNQAWHLRVVAPRLAHGASRAGDAGRLLQVLSALWALLLFGCCCCWTFAQAATRMLCAYVRRVYAVYIAQQISCCTMRPSPQRVILCS